MRHSDSTAEPPIISSELFAVYHGDRDAPPGKYIDLATEATADVNRTPAAYFLLSRELWRAGRFEEAMHAVNVFLSENHDRLGTGTPWNGVASQGPQHGLDLPPRPRESRAGAADV